MTDGQKEYNWILPDNQRTGQPRKLQKEGIIKAMTRGMALDDVQDWQSGIWGRQGCKQLYKTYYYYKKM